MNGRTAHTAALTWTALAWTLLLILLVTGSLLRLAVHPEPAVESMAEVPSEPPSVVVQPLPDELVDKGTAERQPTTVPAVANPKPVSQPDMVDRTAGPGQVARLPENEVSELTGSEGGPEERDAPILSASIPVNGSNKSSADVEIVQQHSDFRERLDYYTVGNIVGV